MSSITNQTVNFRVTTLKILTNTNKTGGRTTGNIVKQEVEGAHLEELPTKEHITNILIQSISMSLTARWFFIQLKFRTRRIQKVLKIIFLPKKAIRFTNQ
jgi:hypothetical protein